MKKSRFTESRIISILKQHESGIRVGDICRKYVISQATFFNWRAKFGGMSSSQLKRLKELKKENAQLKKMYADMSLVHTAYICQWARFFLWLSSWKSVYTNN